MSSTPPSPPPRASRDAMKTPDSDKLRLAALWLQSNDGDESPTMREVADWLMDKAEAADFRAGCKLAGVSVALVRKATGARSGVPYQAQVVAQ